MNAKSSLWVKAIRLHISDTTVDRNQVPKGLSQTGYLDQWERNVIEEFGDLWAACLGRAKDLHYVFSDILLGNPVCCVTARLVFGGCRIQDGTAIAISRLCIKRSGTVDIIEFRVGLPDDRISPYAVSELLNGCRIEARQFVDFPEIIFQVPIWDGSTACFWIGAQVRQKERTIVFQPTRVAIVIVNLVCRVVAKDRTDAGCYLHEQ
ncbi:MAG: hypothetical protein WCA08_07390 [Desulfoferrobacter sp.]